jgi:hypothetical protein
VGDDEVGSQLFLSEMEPDGAPRVASRVPVELGDVLAPKKRISDVEAFARLPDGEVVVYGSHSRDKGCKAKAGRRRYVGLRLGGNAGTPEALPGSVALVRSGKKLRWEDVLGAAPDGVRGRLAEVVRASERAADAGDCADAWNIEGAMATPGAPGAPNAREAANAPSESIWLGLRRPLLGEDAVLVRHDVRADALRITEARTVATGGAGIRALAYDRDLRADDRNLRADDDSWIYGVSAPPRGAADDAYRLWRFPAAALTRPGSAEAIAIESVAPVARHSEGVAIATGSRGRVAVVVQDGKRGANEKSPCEVDATFEVIPLAEPHAERAAPPRRGSPAASPEGSTAWTPPK